MNNGVNALAAGGGLNLYAGGNFSTAGGKPSLAVAALRLPCALVGVDDPVPSPRAFRFAAPWPNPSVRAANIEFNLPSAARVRVEVFDLAGRRVCSPIAGQQLPAGEHRVTWDGRDGSGRRVMPGIYQVRIATGAAVGVRTIVMLD